MPALWRIPKKAKRVFKGRFLEVYQWRQKMFDGSYGTFEMAKAPDVVGIIAVFKNRIIMTRQRQPHSAREYFGFVGGHVEPGEKTIDAAKRELLEETGMESDDWELLREENRSGRMNQNFYFYVARGCKKVAAQDLDPGEKIRLIELNVDQFIGVAHEMMKNNSYALFAGMKYDKRSRAAFEKAVFKKR